MKKYIFAIVVAMVATTTSLSAQGWSFGIKSGLNVATLSHRGDDTDGKNQYNKPRYAGVYGVTTTYNFNDAVSLGAELLYSQQGSRYKYPTNYEYNDHADVDVPDYYENCTVYYRFGYINLPIIFGYKFMEDVRISLKVGIQPSFRVAANTKTKWSDSMGNEEVWHGNTDNLFDYNLYYDGDIKRDYKWFDLGVPIGLEYGFTDKLSLEARYTIGVLNTFNKPADESYDKEFKTYNNSVAITLGYKF